MDDVLKAINTMPRVKGARLLARALTDESVLHPLDMGWEAGRAGVHQTDMHRVMERDAYILLGETQPPYHGRLTRAELRALADRLQTIK